MRFTTIDLLCYCSIISLFVYFIIRNNNRYNSTIKEYQQYSDEVVKRSLECQLAIRDVLDDNKAHFERKRILAKRKNYEKLIIRRRGRC